LAKAACSPPNHLSSPHDSCDSCNRLTLGERRGFVPEKIKSALLAETISLLFGTREARASSFPGEQRNALFDSPADVATIVDPKEAAESVGLRYVSDARPGISRRKLGKGFTYTRADGAKVSEAAVLRRIKALAIPPAWKDVWICPSADGHIQATGRDAKGRKQYRYHPRFREFRESTKYERVVEFADALPRIREKVRQHMALRGLPREKVLATVIHLLETTLIRVGNDDYAKQNNSYGLTTLKNDTSRSMGTRFVSALRARAASSGP
jgi:Eukaryotic DNA topoisomerase I, catalytic core